jgi:hypothetical protein
MNHNAFWQNYIAIASEEESRQYLKNYLFSLPPTEMKKWLLCEAQSIISDLKKQLTEIKKYSNRANKLPLRTYFSFSTIHFLLRSS